MKKGIIQPMSKIKEIDFSKMEKKYTKKGRSRLWYYNIPASYDIETSSFYNENDEPTALTYSHALNIDGYVFKMEYWHELTHTLEYISEKAELDDRHRMIIYVHNLSYEFQFMKNHFEFKDVFSNGSERKILYALTTNGIEFRCSYMLTGSNLANVARNLTTYTIDKMDGDLDYTKIRTPETYLSEEELQYIVNDVVIIEYHIREAMEKSGDITKLPLTNTGYVRELIRDNTIKGDSKENEQYRNLMKSLKLEKEEYLALREAFAGGYTHGNIDKLNQTHQDVHAMDFASSYPGRMLMYKYPMGKGVKYELKDKEDFKKQIRMYNCLFYIELNNITRKANEPYISYSKVNKSKNVTINNGRIDSASSVSLWITEVDYISILKSYDIGSYRVGTLYRYRSGYLPKLFVDCILELYGDKTKFKDLDDFIEAYNRAKELLNSSFGMAVMDIIQPSFEWDDECKYSELNEQDIGDLIDRNNNSRNRFLYYPWGVWITAYSRHDLFDVVVKLEDDYLYSDTDSIYFTNYDESIEIFNESNERIEMLLERACEHHGYDYDIVQPEDIHGVKHTIAVWAYDGFYKRFKTLGAKRYMVEDEKGINITVSGVNKNVAVPYLLDKYENDKDAVFEAFEEGLYIPAGYAGKSTHTYIDDYREGFITDYLGEEQRYFAETGIHLEETSYSMSISDELKEMIEWVYQQKNKTATRTVSSLS